MSVRPVRLCLSLSIFQCECARIPFCSYCIVLPHDGIRSWRFFFLKLSYTWFLSNLRRVEFRKRKKINSRLTYEFDHFHIELYVYKTNFHEAHFFRSDFISVCCCSYFDSEQMKLRKSFQLKCCIWSNSKYNELFLRCWPHLLEKKDTIQMNEKNILSDGSN